MATKRMLGRDERHVAILAQQRGVLEVSWWSTTKTWMKTMGWSTPYWSWQQVFVAKSLESDENFLAVWMHSSVDFWVPSDL